MRSFTWIFVFGITLLFDAKLFAQNQYVFGDSLVDEKGIVSHQMSDGSVWVIGSRLPHGETNMDVVAVRIDTAGNVLSSYDTYGTADLEYPNNMIYQNGRFIIAGEQHNTNSVDGFILVIDTAGNLISFQNYGSPTTTEQFFDIKPTVDGGFVVSGFSSSGPGNDFLIGKFDSAYQLEWLRSHDLGSNDIGVTVLENPNGGFLIAGDQRQPLGNYNVAVMGVDSLGNALWNSVISNPYNGGCKTMIGLEDDVLVVGEMSTDSSSSFDIYLARINWQGNVIWQKSIPKTNSGDACFDAHNSGYNRVVLTGYTYSTTTSTTDMFAMEIDSYGNLLSEQFFHNANFEMGYDVKLNMHGGLILTGFTKSLINGEDEFFVAYPSIGTGTSAPNNELKRLNVTLYPNPTQDIVNVPKVLENLHIVVYDVKGRVYKTMKSEKELSLQRFKNGLYFFTFTNKKGELIHAQKIVKN